MWPLATSIVFTVHCFQLLMTEEIKGNAPSFVQEEACDKNSRTAGSPHTKGTPLPTQLARTSIRHLRIRHAHCLSLQGEASIPPGRSVRRPIASGAQHPSSFRWLQPLLMRRDQHQHQH